MPLSGWPRLNGGLTARRVRPTPRVAEPQMWQEVEIGGLGTAIERFDANADIFGRFFGVLDEDIEIFIAIEYACVQQFELRPRATVAILFDQLSMRIFVVRVFVEHPHVTVSGNVVEVEPIFFRILAVISFITGEPEHALFQDGIAAVPKRGCKHEQLIAVANAGDAVLTPAISLAARLIVREKIPRIAIRAVVLAHGSPRTIADVRSPFTPVRHGADVGFG